MSGIIYPTVSFLFFRVGLIHTSYLLCRWRGAAQNVGSRGRTIDRRWSRGARTTEDQSNTCLFKASYNGPIRCNVAASCAPIAWATDHRRSINARAFIQGVITVVMRSGGAHPDCPIAIQGAKTERFYNAYQAVNLDPPSQIRRMRHFRKRSIMDRLP